ncbi:hypothetical protein N865_17480 [Intrasporangium oryzae NRRL B-24470]|uniref:Diguanylate cyclase n=1 Tax=Intrasporangium oryzae NRRL B-24470 TaxID=1386089 RepID=W9GBG7_9MICO|nr:GGDEF domain-containing protein [Intrasporangium oryzae]EWT03526.1 hypothetical protein N865_17480 [Intrasporangium oryzae NRRL B-24470]
MMLDRSAAVWTEFRARFGLAAFLLVSSGVLVGMERGRTRVALLVLVLVAAAVALHVDGFVGIVVGLVGAALLIAVKRTSGDWGSDELPVIAAEVSVLLVLPWVIGVLGDHLRASLATLAKPVPGSLVPARNSLGLLDEAPALFRLEEELQRRRRTGQPLGLMLVEVEVWDPDLDEESEAAARRSVARHVETLLRDIDVPFALSGEVIGAILPATDPGDAWSLLGPLLDSATTATFADREAGFRRAIFDCATLHGCLAFADDDTEDAEALLQQALVALATSSEPQATAS